MSLAGAIVVGAMVEPRHSLIVAGQLVYDDDATRLCHHVRFIGIRLSECTST